MVAAMVLLSFNAFKHSRKQPFVFAGTFVTRMDEPQDLMFADGSSVARSPGSRLTVTPVDASDPGPWRDGWLTYRNESLRAVIAALSRYTELKVDVEESAGELRFSGVVSKERISEWVVALPEVSPVAVERNSDRLMIKLRAYAILVSD